MILNSFIHHIMDVVHHQKRMVYLRIFFRFRIMTSKRTIRYIINHKCSVARFGNGELDLILCNLDEGYQKPSELLSKSLLSVLQNHDKRLLICIPRYYNSVFGCNEYAKRYWIDWGKNGHHEEVFKLIANNTGQKYKFGDTQMTRPYIDKKHKSSAKKVFELLKQLWQDKDIIIVEGSKTCLGVGNDLFSNTKSIHRIIAPHVNAFESYNLLMEAILSNANGELFILALGATATVLASNLSQYDIQAIDIGHLDIEYEWFLMKANEKVPIPGKFTNEAGQIGRSVSDCQDPNYLKQIICRIN